MIIHQGIDFTGSAEFKDLLMKKRPPGRIVELFVACAFLCVTGAVAQNESGE